MNTKKRKYKSLSVQLAITITAFIVLIEGILLVISYSAKEKELHQLNLTLEKSIEDRYGYQIKDVLEPAYIEQRIKDYARNIIGLTILIIVTVVIGSLSVFYFIAGRHLYELIQFNQNFDSANPETFPEEKIPHNDIGELITTQNIMINDLADSLDQIMKTKEELKLISFFALLNPDPVMRFNSDGKISVANPAALKEFAIKNMENTKWNEIIPSVKFSDIKHLFTNHGMIDKEVVLNDKTYLLRIVGAPRINSVNIYSFDISVQKNLQNQVFMSSKLASIGELAAGVGHEVNNPLAIIKIKMESLENKLKKSEQNESEALKTVEQVNKSVDRISNVISGLKNFSRTSDTEEVYNPHQLLDESVGMVQKIYENMGIQIIKDYQAGDISIKGNMSRLQQVVFNLMTNAKDALKNITEAKITIKTYCNKNKFHFEVSDNGCGIDKGDLKNIFQSFYTTKARGEGSGLGLGIVKTIMSEINGEISVKTARGYGTSFIVSLQISQESPEVKESASDETPSEIPNIKYVLLVEDEEDLNEIISDSLSSAGLIVKNCLNPIEALKAMEVQDYDLIISDVQMPEMNGLDFLTKVREKLGHEQLFVLMTGGENQGAEGHLADALIYKPFSMKVFKDTLSKLGLKKSAA